ncbi:WD40-repeat-containing domain protein [Globomyces pollinis-pini]|nr:WD40-repeat-containing domain protein [Globomyces pollinis-pini]
MTDFQGIPHSQKQKRREERVREYQLFRFIDNHKGFNLDSVKNEINNIYQTGNYFKLFNFDQTYFPSYEHRQLRHLLSCPKPSNVIYTHFNTVNCWNSFTNTHTVLLDLHDQVACSRITSISALNDLLVIGGFSADFLLKRLDASDEPIINGTIADSSRAITNHLKLSNSRNRGPQCIVSSNDDKLRIVDLERLKTINEFSLSWAPNCSTQSPDGRLICVVGDSNDSLLIAPESGKCVGKLTGHCDYTFACDWLSSGNVIATGGQDMTTRLYDTRRMGSPFFVFQATMGPVRSLTFSPDGQFLLMAESADYIQVIDMKRLENPQVFDFFGEISGTSWSPNSDVFYVGNSGKMSFRKLNLAPRYGGIIEYKKRNIIHEYGLI